jgi:hypothetical protein
MEGTCRGVLFSDQAHDIRAEKAGTLFMTMSRESCIARGSYADSDSDEWILLFTFGWNITMSISLMKEADEREISCQTDEE